MVGLVVTLSTFKSKIDLMKRKAWLERKSIRLDDDLTERAKTRLEKTSAGLVRKYRKYRNKKGRGCATRIL